MQQSTTTTFSPCASLAAIGCHLQQLALFEPIRKQVHIEQKRILHSPIDKLYDAFITILAGAHGLVEVNTRLRADATLQAAFGRDACADQSTIQATLNACSSENVSQMSSALTSIFRLHSLAYRHNYQARPQVLDVDLSGMPCGKKAALATKGYFANKRNRRGRQLGRVLATRYGEIVCDQVFNGKVSLASALQPLVQACEQVLELDEPKRRQTILRIDSGGGSLDDVNWAIERGYQLHTKEYSRQRARKLAQSVTKWIADPLIADREVGWVEAKAPEYHNALLARVAVRWPKADGQWEYAVVLSTLTPQRLMAELGEPAEKVLDHEAVLLAYVRYYDDRGGGVETSYKEDKSGLGLLKRNKKRFAAQQMVVLLSALAHNVIVWARRWLAPHESKVRKYGMKRMVRDIFHISGFVMRNASGRIVQILLNERAPLVRGLSRSLDVLLRPQRVAVIWGQT
jgi:hypothetical protein